MKHPFEIVVTWLKRWRDLRYLSSNSQKTFDDLGMSPDVVQGLAQAPDDTRCRMEKMATSFGLVPGVIDEERWRVYDMAVACGHCRQRAKCTRFFDNKEDLSEAYSFCPNAHLYDELKILTDK